MTHVTPVRVFLATATVVGLLALWRVQSLPPQIVAASTANGSSSVNSPPATIVPAAGTAADFALYEKSFGKFLTPTSRAALANRITIPATSPDTELTAYMMFLPIEQGLNISEFNWLIDIAEHHQSKDTQYFTFGILNDVVRSEPFKKQPERLQSIQDLCTMLLASKEEGFRSAGAILVFRSEELRAGSLGSIVREMGTSDPSESVRGSITAKLNELAALEALKTGTSPKDPQQ